LPLGGFGTGATAVGLGGVGVGVGFTGPSVFTGLGLADALAEVVVAAAAVAETTAELAGALLGGVKPERAAADPGAEAAALDARRLSSAELAAAELWCAEWLQAALRPASAAMMVAVTAVLGVRLMLHHRLGGSRSEAIRGPIWLE
jgi:hypothetical protein